MSRVEAGSFPAERQVVDLGELVQLTVLRLAALFPHAVVEVQIDPALPLVDGDPVLLDEVISNLLENAARYAPPQSTVRVELTATEERTVMLTVADEGAGVDPAHSDDVFQPFWRGPESNSSGLGLAIARGIVESHGGSIRLDQSSCGGATFVVELPAREGAML
jgi:two-component system sensor histidine kinase KdpD